MSAIFAQVIGLYQSKKFIQAFHQLMNLNVRNFNEDEHGKFFELGLEILRSIPLTQDSQQLIYSFLQQAKSFGYIDASLGRLRAYEGSIFFNLQFQIVYWELLRFKGAVTESVILQKKILQSLKKSKNIIWGMKIINAIEQTQGLQNEWLEYKIDFLLYRGDFRGIQGELKKNCEEQEDAELSDYIFTHPQLNWRRHREFFQLHLDNKFSKIYLQDESVQKKSFPEFLNDLYEYVARHGVDTPSLIFLLKYALLSKKKDYIRSVLDFYEKNYPTEQQNETLKDDIIGLIKAIQTIQEEEYDVVLPDDQEFDLGTDLLSDNTAFDISIRKLKQDIDFLKCAGNEDAAIRLEKRLRLLDDEKTSVLEERTGTNVVASSGSELGQPSAMAPVDHYLKLAENVLNKGLEDFDEKLIQHQYADLFMMYFFLRDYRHAQAVLDKAEELIDRSDTREVLNIYYLRSVSLQSEGRFKEALIPIGFVLANYPITDEERLGFLKLKLGIMTNLKRETDISITRKEIANLEKRSVTS